MTTYLLKCDISGIQKFIFNVPSKGAAKALKSRSVYVQTIADDCLRELKVFFDNENPCELYNGGGNFYLEVETKKTETEILVKIKEIENWYIEKDIFPYISFVERKSENLGFDLDAVNKAIQKAKIHRPISLNLLNARPEEVKGVDIFKDKGINGQIPKESPSKVSEFKDIANRSDGNKKLAALKIDVDDLGSLFRNRNENEYKKLSESLKKFFDSDLLILIEDLDIQQKIYTVFSGGDDCFLIGSWNDIFELAIILRKKFAVFQENIRKEVHEIDKEITFSAGIVVFAPHSPVLQIAEEVEDELSASKRTKEKNSVTVFGKTLSWAEFEKTQSHAKTLFEMCSNEGKSLLQIFRLITPYEKEMPKVWRLKYYLKRNVKKENFPKVQQIFKDFETSLLLKYYDKETKEKPEVFMVSSRWAELLLK